MAYTKINRQKMKTGPKPRPFVDRFWALVDKRGEDECWPWKGGTRNGRDYGNIMDDNGRQVNAHRASFIIHYGDPGELWVMHSCTKIRHCVNPRHLYTGDRVAWAQKTHGITLSDDDVRVRQQRMRERVKKYYWSNVDERRIKSAEYQMRAKIKAIKYLGGRCQRCKFEHPSALQFHHRDPSLKILSITMKELGSPKKHPWDTVIRPELDKCDLLCANCHFLTHAMLSPERVEELKAE
jgi:hypothetical protein